MILVTLISWLLIGCLVVTSQSPDPDNRWVWQSLRSPSTSLELPLNPFAPFPSSSEETHQRNPRENSSSNDSKIPEGNPEDIISQRGNPEGALLSSFSPAQATTPLPNVGLNLGTVGRNNNPPLLGDSRRVEQQHLGIAHFTIPRQLGRPATVTAPTSNHLPAENELLVSSYSSLDAEVTGLSKVKNSKNRNGGRNLINPPVQKTLESIAIKPLPIDISKLPLESTERAEGIKKLWSSLTSRTEFAQIFEALAGRRRNNSSERAERNPNPEDESSSILLDPHNSISESVIRVINPPQIQLQQQILKQQLRQQELQRRLQEQFEAEIQQQELKKRLELQKLIREREEQEQVQQKVDQEEHRELLRRQQQLQTQDGRKKLTDDEQLSEELQELVDPEDILRRRHELLVERLQRRKESQSEQRRTLEEVQERRRRLHELQQQQRLQQLRQRLEFGVLSTTSSSVAGLTSSTEPSENDVSEEILPQRSPIVFPPPLPVPSRSLSLPNLDVRGINEERFLNTTSTTSTTSTLSGSTAQNPGTNTNNLGSNPNNPGTNTDNARSSGTRGVPTATSSIGGSGSTSFPGTLQGDTITNRGTNPASTSPGGTDDGAAGNLLQTTVRFPQREGDFVVRKIRLPGNHIMNVVFVPDELHTPTGPRPDISKSPSALRLFQSEDVQQSLLEVENQNTVLVVEELIRGGKNLYLITTMEGDRVYPKEPESEESEGNVWAAFVGVFSGESNASAPSSFSFRHDSPTSIGSSDVEDPTVDSLTPVIRDTRTPIAKVSFSAGNVQRLRGRSELPSRSPGSFQAPHAFLVKFSGRENYNPFAPVANRGPIHRHSDQNKPLPSSMVSSKFFNPFQSQAPKSVGRSLNVQPSGGRDSHKLGIPIEARGLESRHSRWPWPHEVPENLDAFFPSGPADFRTPRSIT